MGQDFNIISTANVIFNDVARHNTNYATLRSQFSGTSFPSSPLTGQPCLITDRGLDDGLGGKLGILYRFSGNVALGEDGWLNPDEVSANIMEPVGCLPSSRLPKAANLRLPGDMVLRGKDLLAHLLAPAVSLRGSCRVQR